MFNNCTVSTISKVGTDVCSAEHKQIYLHILCTGNSDDHTNVNRNDSATQTNDVMSPGTVSQEVLAQLVLQLKSTQEQVAMKEVTIYGYIIIIIYIIILCYMYISIVSQHYCIRM